MIATAPGHAGGIGEFVSDALQHLRAQKALAIAPTFTAQEQQQFDDFSELLAARIAQNGSPGAAAANIVDAASGYRRPRIQLPAGNFMIASAREVTRAKAAMSSAASGGTFTTLMLLSPR